MTFVILSPIQQADSPSVARATSTIAAVIYPADDEGKEWGPITRLVESAFGPLAGWSTRRDVLSRISNSGIFTNAIIVRANDEDHYRELVDALPVAIEALLGVAAAPLA